MHAGAIGFLRTTFMYGYSESGPERKKSPHEEFSYAFYNVITDKTEELFPEQILNFGYMCTGEGKVSRISFSHADGSTLNEQDWTMLKEHACDIFAEAVTRVDTVDEINSTNTTLSFSNADPEYNGDQTIIISEV